MYIETGSGARSVSGGQKEAADITEQRPYYLAGQWQRSDQPLEVRNPYDGSTVGVTSFATEADVEEAITAAERAFEDTRRLSSYERYDALTRIRRGMEQRRDELVRLIVREAGKPPTVLG